MSRIAVLLLLVVVAACGARRPAPARERTILEVDNRAFGDVHVYVYEGARRTSVGIAGGLKKTALTIPPHVVGNSARLRFQADPIGGTRQSYSEEIYVKEGDHISLVIPP